MFTYSHVCPQCGEVFESMRKKPYKMPRVRKTCPNCKAEQQSNKAAIEFGGQGSETSCDTCVHFGCITQRETNRWWRACARGKFSLGGQGFLVYFEDVCEEYDPKDDDEDTQSS